MSVVAGVFLVAGSLLTMIGGIGVVRFGDLMSRVHAAAKAPTLGLLLIAVGAGIEIGTGPAAATLVLAVILQLFTSPVATHVLARASYGQVDITLDGDDDLATYYESLRAGVDADLVATSAAEDDGGSDPDHEPDSEPDSEPDGEPDERPDE